MIDIRYYAEQLAVWPSIFCDKLAVMRYRQAVDIACDHTYEETLLLQLCFLFFFIISSWGFWYKKIYQQKKVMTHR